MCLIFNKIVHYVSIFMDTWGGLHAKKNWKQAGAELGQAQLKLGLDFSVDLVTLDLIC